MPSHNTSTPTAHPAAGEEEEADDFPLGSVEKAPAALRAPSAGVCAAFASDRLKHETAPADSPLTKIVLGALRQGGWGKEGVYGVGGSTVACLVSCAGAGSA